MTSRLAGPRLSWSKEAVMMHLYTPCRAVLCHAVRRYSNAADIWSVGITLIELATGKPPLARCHPLRVLSDTMHCPPPSLPPDSCSKRFSKVCTGR